MVDEGDLLEGYQSSPGERNFSDQVITMEMDGGCNMMVKPAWFHDELGKGNETKK